MSNENLTRSVVIVGGGTSGWLCAAYMANKLGTQNAGGPSIVLLESSEIPTIGVGEATIPPIKSAIASTGLEEAEFLKEAQATFKMAIRFDGWCQSAQGKDPSSFYHAFGAHGRIGSEPLAPYWLLDPSAKGKSFVEYSMNNGPIIEAGKGPKRPTDSAFGGPLDYAYHFDAGLLARLLKKRALSLGVTHLVDTVDQVDRSGDHINSITTTDGRTLSADLFVDCTGFHALLIEKSIGEPFVSVADVLFCDSAVACPAEYAADQDEIPPYTKSVARKNGWIWDVPLQHRRGTGIVYSSQHQTEEQARADLLEYLGPTRGDAEPRSLKFRVGYRKQPWRGNCVAIGLSGGFVEPLESTGIYITDIAVRWLTDFGMNKAQYEPAARAFNNRVEACYRDVIDFVKLHYVLSDRGDSDFWTSNRVAESIPDSLQEKLAMWAHRLPSEYEFGHLPAVFSYSNYLQIMMGMGYHPPTDSLQATYRNVERAAEVSRQLGTVAQSGIATLPGHRALLAQLTGSAKAG